MEQSPIITNYVIRAQQGDQQAFSEIYKAAYKVVYLTCLGHMKNPEDAEDATQETFVIVYTKLSTLNNPNTYFGWVKMIAVRVCLAKIKSIHNDLSFDDAIGVEEQIDASDYIENLPDSAIMEETKRNVILNILHKELSEAQYQTVFMFYYNNMPVEQIAAFMGCPVGTVKSRLMLSRSKIKRGIEEYENKTGDRLCAVGMFPALGMLFNSALGSVPVNIAPWAIGAGIAGAGAAGSVAAGATGAGAAGKAGASGVATVGKVAKAAKSGATATKAIMLKVVASTVAVGAIGATTVTVTNVVRENNKKAKKRNEAKIESIREKEEAENTAVSIEPTVDYEDLLIPPSVYNVGERIQIGAYADQPIMWTVIDEQDGKYLVLSDNVIAVTPYDEDDNCTWENSGIRTWLNDRFYETTFDDNEKKNIADTKVSAASNAEYDIDGGHDTTDKVFILSIEELDGYYKQNEDRVCIPTSHAHDMGVLMDDDSSGCFWWLRSPGYYEGFNAIVTGDGIIVTAGSASSSTNIGVRPAMWITAEK